MPGSPSRTVVHLSDLHFGRDDRKVVEALHTAVATLAPDVVAVSGDLTQRARRGQFRRARAFLDTLPSPRIVVPGNHDVPLYNVMARMFRPLGGYTRFITSDLQPTVGDDILWVTGVNTTRPSRWKSGHIPPPVLRRLQTSIDRAAAGAIKILVAHHPFDPPEKAAGARQVLSTLAAAGIDVFLTGHLHTSYTGHTAHRYAISGRTAVVVEAGTATSTRLRDEANAFNVLRVRGESIAVEMHAWDGAAFAVAAAQQFSRTAAGWIPAGP